MFVRLLAPSREETMFVNPLSTLGAAALSVCRVEDSDSPTSELALRTTFGVKWLLIASSKLPGLRNCDTAI
jgi:hypothetical protein